MIIIKVGNNGLGNQLYDYALGIVMEEIYGTTDVVYDVSQHTRSVRGRTMYNISDVLGIDFCKASLKQIRKATGMRFYRKSLRYFIAARDDALLYEYMQKLWRSRKPETYNVIIDENTISKKDRTIDYILRLIDSNRPDTFYYLAGYWQNMNYFARYEHIIKKKFRLSATSVNCKRYLGMIEAVKAVSVHIRRGDFRVKNSNLQFCVCHNNYYVKAFNYVNSLCSNLHYFFFSDDMVYVKSMYLDIKNVTFVEDCRDYEDLFLMTRCNMNIISNSTFSFWGGYLNIHEEAVVVAPKIQYLEKKSGRWSSVNMSVPDHWKII